MDKQAKQEVNQNRRRALLGTATGAALVTAWHKPIVNAVISPAHAQMSEDEFGIDSGTVFIDLNRNQNQTVSNEQQRFSPLDLLISPAHAGDGPPGDNGDVKVTYNGGGMFDYEHINRNGYVKREGMVAVGEINEVDVVEDCRPRRRRDPGQHSVEVLTASATGVTLRITAVLDNNNGNENGNDPGDTTYFLEPGDATLETDCDEQMQMQGQGQGQVP